MRKAPVRLDVSGPAWRGFVLNFVSMISCCIIRLVWVLCMKYSGTWEVSHSRGAAEEVGVYKDVIVHGAFIHVCSISLNDQNNSY